MSRVISSLVCLGAVLAVARSASGDQDRVFTLKWQAPAECPSHEELRAGIERLLGGEIRVTPERRLEARARVTHDPSWAVIIETESAGRAGRRFIEAPSCRDLADATAFIIALMIDPDAVAAHATQTVPPNSAAAAPVSPKAPPTTKFLAGIHTAVSQGTLPSLDVGLGAGVGLTGKRWRVELRGTYGLRRDQKATVANPQGAYGRFNFMAATLAGCLNLGRGGLAYGPCADTELGVVSAQGFGVDQSLPAHTLWWALGAGLYTSVPLGHHLSLPVHADVLAPLRRPDFVFKDDAGTTTWVFRNPTVGVRVSAGIDFTF